MGEYELSQVSPGGYLSTMRCLSQHSPRGLQLLSTDIEDPHGLQGSKKREPETSCVAYKHWIPCSLRTTTPPHAPSNRFHR
jgi:hypothetical protein